jgi:hypothetical protein
VIFGSDYPHLEAWPNRCPGMDSVSGLTDDELRLVMGGKVLSLLDIVS